MEEALVVRDGMVYIEKGGGGVLGREREVGDLWKGMEHREGGLGRECSAESVEY